MLVINLIMVIAIINRVALHHKSCVQHKSGKTSVVVVCCVQIDHTPNIPTYKA